MDAMLNFRKTAILIVAALLLAVAPIHANGVATVQASAPTVALQGCPGSLTKSVSLTSSDGTAVGFTIAVPPNTWLSVVADQNVTPATVTFSVGNTVQYSPLDVTIHPTNGAADITVGVTYTAGCGGGSTTTGALQISPSSLSLATSSSSTLTSYLTVQNTTSTAVDMAAATAATWLTLSPLAATVPANGSVIVTVTGNAAGLAASTTYNDFVTITPAGGLAVSIPVAFAIGANGGGSGTLRVGTGGSSTTAVVLAYNTSDPTPNQYVSVQSTAGATYYYTTLSPNNSWLTANGGYSTTGYAYPVAGGLAVGVSGNVTALTTGTYQGTITLTDSNGASATVNVTLTVNGGAATGVTISPSSTWTPTATAGSAAVQQQTLTVLGGNGTTVSAAGVTVTTGQTWLTYTAQTVNANSFTLTLSANPAGLTAGIYSANIRIPSVDSDGNAGATNVAVVFTVTSGSGGGTSSAGVAPTSLAFYYQLGSNTNFGRRQLLAVTGQSGTFSASTATSWLSLSGTTGTVPSYLEVSINPANLTAGSYTGSITVNTAAGTSNVPVTLQVTANTAPVLLAAAPASAPASDLISDAVFTYSTTAGGFPAEQSVIFRGSDGSIPFISNTEKQGAWLTATASQSIVNLSVDPSGLTTGTYVGWVQVTANNVNYTNSPLRIPVILVVNGGSSSAGILTFNPSTISLSATAGGAAVTQSLGITSSTSNSYTVTASTQSGGSWLSINAYSVMGGQTLTVTADPNGLAAGTYQGTLTFSSGQTVSVGFTVAASGVGSGNVAVTATGQTGTPTLTFAYQSGGTAPAKQTLHIANASGGTARIPFSVSATSTPSGWISTSYTSSATTPYDLDVTVSPTGLPVGTYHGVVRFYPNNGAVISVPVTLNVTLPPVISATPGSLTFAYQSGGTVPDAVPVAVSGGGAALTFTATAASTGNWLTVTPTSGTTAAGAGTTSLSVSVSPASLQVGTYNGTIVVAGSGSATGSSTINVTLTVTAPLPVISKVVNAATQAPGAISPGLLISIYAPTDGKNPIGPATAVQTAVENGFVKTTLGGVQVLFNNIAAPLTYVSATQINAVVPYELKGVTSPFVQVKFNDQPSNSFQLTAATTAPGLFTTSGTGVGQAAIVNQNNTVNGSSNPAAPGSVVTLYLTGEGETSPAGSTGKVTTVASSAPLTPQPLLPLGVTIDGQPAAVKFWGEAPSMVSGVLQINVEVPSGAATGSLPVVVSFVGGGSSQTGVTIAVRR